MACVLAPRIDLQFPFLWLLTLGLLLGLFTGPVVLAGFLFPACLIQVSVLDCVQELLVALLLADECLELRLSHLFLLHGQLLIVLR